MNQPDNQGFRLTIAVMLCVSMSCWIGCRKSDTSDSSVVPPPDRTNRTESTSSSDPPGGMVLPPDAVPSPVPEQPKPSGGFEMPDDVDVPNGSGASALPDVQYAGWEAIQTAAASTGRTTVVDLWSLSCEPCLKEFPQLVRLHQTMGSSVQCIAVNIDFDGRKSRPPEHYRDQVTSFLNSVDATGFPTYICSTPSDEVFAAANIDSIPAVLVYGPDGKPLKVYANAGETIGFTYEKDILPLLEKLTG